MYHFNKNNSLAGLLFSLLICSLSYAQVSDYVLSVRSESAYEGKPIQINVELNTAFPINQLTLAYRTFGSTEFKYTEIPITERNVIATIPPEEFGSSNVVEYYFLLNVEGNPDAVTYPQENPTANPLQITIRPASELVSKVLFLSPEPGSAVTKSDLVIVLSLVKLSALADKNSTKIFIDEKDVTGFAQISDDILSLSPENITPTIDDGAHSIRVEVRNAAQEVLYTESLSFTSRTIATTESAARKIEYHISAQIEKRNESIQKNLAEYNRGSVNLSSQYGVVHLNGKVFVTNEDTPIRQPQNRFFVEAKTPWVKAAYGDAYPAFPSLIMSGKRLRGVSGSLMFGFINLDAASGEVARKVEGQTYKRNLTIVRPSFGKGENFQLGFSLLKAKDNLGSILTGPAAKENLVVGSDLLLAFDKKRFALTAQGAASVHNNDIRAGNFSDAQIDSLYKTSGTDSVENIKKRKDLKQLRDMISKIITVNQNLVPLSIDNISSIVSYEGGLSANYFNNNLKATYIFHGGAYKSFGQTYLPTDLKGYNIFDRISLFESQLFLSGGIEQLKDNTDNNKSTTTTFTTLNSNVSYFPRMNFPSLTIGYTRNHTSNGLKGFIPVSSGDSIKFRSMREDISNRFFIQSGYDFTYLYRQSLSVNASTSIRDDQTLHNTDTKNSTASLGLTTHWKEEFQTTLNVLLSLNKLPKAGQFYNFNYETILFGARHSFLNRKFTVAGAAGTTLGDFKRTQFSANSDYLLWNVVHLAADLTLLHTPKSPTVTASTDVLWSFVVKYTM